MDPLTQTIQLLKPAALLWKQMEARGPWAIAFPGNDAVVFCLVTAGRCVLTTAGAPPREMHEGDFVWMSAPQAWTLGDSAQTPAVPMTGMDAAPGAKVTPLTGGLMARIGESTAPLSARVVGGHFRFGDAHSLLLRQLLPRELWIASSEVGAQRLRRVLDHISEEAAVDRPGMFLVVQRLLEIMLVEALRHAAADPQAVGQGLLCGLAEPRIAAALQAMHAQMNKGWTVAQLASVAGMSRSTFAEHFMRRVGCPPMDYLLNWRMAMARQALREGAARLSEVAYGCGYQSASAFSAAFLRTEGCTPSRYAAAFKARAESAAAA